MADNNKRDQPAGRRSFPSSVKHLRHTAAYAESSTPGTSSTPDEEDKPANFTRKRKAPKFSRSPTKRPRYELVSSESSFPTTAMGFPLHTYFPIYASNLGLDDLCISFYSLMRRADHRLADHLPLWVFRYACHLAWITRIIHVAASCGYYLDDNEFLLMSKVSKLRFPDFIANYVETFGAVRTLNGTCCVPYVTRHRDWFGIRGAVTAELHASEQLNWTKLYLDPRLILIQNGYMVPTTPWSINSDVLIQYIDGSSRLTKPELGLRQIDFAKVEGKDIMLVTTRQVGEDRVVGVSCQSMLRESYSLGAAYLIRREEQRESWPGQYTNVLYPTYEGESCDRALYLAQLVLQHTTKQ